MRKDTRFKRPSREDLESRLPSGTLSDSQVVGIWNMMLQSDDPSEVSRWYRSYRDSPHCSVPREKLRAMRDTMIIGMREENKNDPTKRLEKKKGTHYMDYENEWTLKPREGA
jgi:hypothetical protein